MDSNNKLLFNRFIKGWMYDNSTDECEFVDYRMWTEPFHTSRPRVMNLDLFLATAKQRDAVRRTRIDETLATDMRAEFAVLEETEIVINFLKYEPTKRSTDKYKLPPT